MEKILTLSDLVAIVKRSKKTILIFTLLFAVLGALFSLTRPLQYTAEGSFREREKTTMGGKGNVLTSLLASGNSSGNQAEAISVMQSHRLLTPLVKNLSLQAVLSQKTDRENSISKMVRNLKTAWAHFRHKPYPIFRDNQTDLKVTQVSYAGEIPISYQLEFLTDSQYKVIDPSTKIEIAQANLGESLQFNQANITLNTPKSVALKGQKYNLSILPMRLAVASVQGGINIEPSLKDKSLLEVTYTHSDRQFAAEFANTLMRSYQEYQRKDHEEIARRQLSYLRMRQEEISQDLNEMMLTHAQKLFNDTLEFGFMNTDQAMKFLASVQQNLKEQLFSLDLEIKRLKKTQEEDISSSRSLSVVFASYPQIQPLISQIQQLKQQRENLDLALRNDPFLTEEKQLAFFKSQIDNLKEIQYCRKDINNVIALLEQDRLPTQSFHHPKYINPAWEKELGKARRSSQAEWDEIKFSFLNYLENLSHLLTVHERSIQERLSHQSGQSDFQGIALPTAENLYVMFHKDLQQIQTETEQYQHILNQMETDGLEISTLSISLKDPVSAEMIKESKSILMDLRDEQNRMPKEQERLKERLQLQRDFLQTHLEQATNLLNLNANLLQEKIFHLQNAMLGSIQQQITILLDQVKEFITSQIVSLEQEKELLSQHLQDTQKDIEKIPSQWVSETIITHNLRMYETMFQEITHLVESKNITSNLELIRSSPLDWAEPPVLPNSPKLLFFMLIGAVFGSLSGFCFALYGSLQSGIPVTSRNLEDRGANVLGFLSGEIDQKPLSEIRIGDLSTLRATAERLTTSKVLLLGRGPDYSKALAELLAKRGSRVLLMSLQFNKNDSDEGLCQYLEGSIEKPKILSHSCYDEIPCGGKIFYREELLGSDKFKKLLKQLEESYDWILGVSQTFVDSSEAKILSAQFDHDLLSVSKETVDQIQPYFQNLDKCSFLFF